VIAYLPEEFFLESCDRLSSTISSTSK